MSDKTTLVGVEIKDGDTIIGIWMVPNRYGDTLLALIQHADGSTTAAGRVRTAVRDSRDLKSFFTVSGLTKEILDEQAASLSDVSNGGTGTVDYIPVNGDIFAVLKALENAPWARVVVATKDSVH